HRGVALAVALAGGDRAGGRTGMGRCDHRRGKQFCRHAYDGTDEPRNDRWRQPADSGWGKPDLAAEAGRCHDERMHRGGPALLLVAALTMAACSDDTTDAQEPPAPATTPVAELTGTTVAPVTTPTSSTVAAT